jgi:hypothetical protein
LRSAGIRRTKSSRSHNRSKCFFLLLSYKNNQYEKQFVDYFDETPRFAKPMLAEVFYILINFVFVKDFEV